MMEQFGQMNRNQEDLNKKLEKLDQNSEELKKQMKESIESVSYTHLDVYKRQRMKRRQIYPKGTNTHIKGKDSILKDRIWSINLE